MIKKVKGHGGCVEGGHSTGLSAIAGSSHSTSVTLNTDLLVGHDELHDRS